MDPALAKISNMLLKNAYFEAFFQDKGRLYAKIFILTIYRKYLLFPTLRLRT